MTVAPKITRTTTLAAASAAAGTRRGIEGAKSTATAHGGAPIRTSGPESDPATQSGSISHYFDLEIEARQCTDLDALRFAIVNSTRKLAAFDQAFLAEPALTGGWNIARASSVSKIDRNAALIRALDAWLQHPGHASILQRGEPRQADLEREALEWDLRTKSYTLPHALWLPIKARDGRVLAALLALKSENWRPQHTALMMPLADAYGHAWDALAPRASATVEQVRGYLSKSRIAWAIAACLLVAAFIPVPMSALAPAEIVAADSMLVTAPLDGVVGDILAPPGAWVEKGATIVRFVDIKLRNDAEVAARSRAVAEARYFKVVQSALATQKDMQDLATAKAELDVAGAELAYAQELLARSEIRAERAGLLIYSAKSDWLGKPVAVGERLMEIGDPAKSEMKIELPVADAIALRAGGTVSLFLDGDPLRTIDGTLVRTSFRPTLTADQQLAFRSYAKFTDGQPRRIGLRGIARVDGDTVSLWLYLFRRPIAAARQRIGL
jgi:HlyD family secretion protein